MSKEGTLQFANLFANLQQSGKFSSLDKRMSSKLEGVEKTQAKMLQFQEEEREAAEFEQVKQERNAQVKNFLFEVKVSTEEAQEERDPLVRGIFLGQLAEELGEAEVSTDDLDDFQDKEYAHSAMKALDEALDAAESTMSDQDYKDLETFEKVLNENSVIEKQISDEEEKREELVGKIDEIKIKIDGPSIPVYSRLQLAYIISGLFFITLCALVVDATLLTPLWAAAFSVWIFRFWRRRRAASRGAISGKEREELTGEVSQMEEALPHANRRIEELQVCEKTLSIQLDEVLNRHPSLEALGDDD